MAFDALKGSVAEYGDKRAQLMKDNADYRVERDKVDSLSSTTSHLDVEVTQAIEGIQHSFDLEKRDLDKRDEDLQRERDNITRKIADEQTKIESAQKKLDGLSGKRFTGNLDAVSQKCDELLSQLDDMLKDVDKDSGAGSYGGMGADISSMQDKKISTDTADVHESKGSIWSKLFSKHQSTSNGPKFGNFDLAPIKGGSDYFVQGVNYSQFISDYYNSEQSTYESLRDNEILTTISPADIEGIHLGKTEAADSSIFWRQHESGGTKESFVEIASHIPEVRSLLDSGLSLEDIRENPTLERCVNIYFDPSNIPRVIQSNGYYEFDGNGRHRILAAREAGYDIPVKIVGIRRWT